MLREVAREDEMQRLLLTCLTALAIVAGCKGTTETAQSKTAQSASNPSNSTTVEGVNITIAAGDLTQLDPPKIPDLSSAYFADNAFIGLTRHPVAGAEKPDMGIAESYTRSGDGLTYNFLLKEDLVWSDGTTLTPEQMKESLLRALDPATAATQAKMLFSITGAEAYNSSKGTAENVGIKVDGQTITITLTYPNAIEWALADPIAAPVPMHVIKKYGDQWTRPEHFVCNGEYMLVQHEPRSKAIYKKNPQKLKELEKAPDTITMILTSDEQTSMRRYNAGSLDVLFSGISADRIPEMERTQFPGLQAIILPATLMVNFNVKVPPFDQVKARQAFHAAIDKEALTLHALHGTVELANSFVPPMFTDSGYTSPTVHLGDPAQLLAEAGYPQGMDIPTLTYIYNTRELEQTVAVFLQRQVSEKLGVKINPENMEFKSYIQKILRKDFQLARGSWNMDMLDPIDTLSIFLCKSENNVTNWCNPEFDKLVEAARRELDSIKRNRMMQEAEKILLTETPAFPLYFGKRHVLIRPELCGIAKNPRGLIRWSKLRWTDDCEEGGLYTKK